ncbi:glycoside hydrolase family 1 protein [Bifidobacterium eulemuris]|uniref:beta-glucosidase n=1 Tax=Bifidobacterium eulemuris TaxID=1765219 RepID=A0A261G226_9BIFI|nr:family 1 glycosylhydrolase [Bifidobacterium eulemuris]OZG65026.1 beta-glucosidase [Bifidobacterium eulemuris]QOL32846.1 family 1 glycosylhydrolase [Bifidobacterium eulemuris]
MTYDDELAARYPAGFLWGAATAAHQIEGNNINSDWWAREHAVPASVKEPSGDAVDSYHRFDEDIRLLADAGLRTYRFSVEWARIEPAPGCFSNAELAHYRRMIEACVTAGVEPMVTLMHFTTPQWFAQSGGWTQERAVELFVRYVRRVMGILGDDVRLVCTINEPNIASMMARFHDESADLQAAGLPEPDMAIAEALRDAHKAAVSVLREGGYQAGWSVATQAFYADACEDRDGAPTADEVLRAYAWPRERWFIDAARGDDFIGVQAYTRTRITASGPQPVPDGAELTKNGWEYYPQASGDGIDLVRAMLPDMPIYITENGIATDDDARRVDYLRGSLTAIADRIEGGADVRGFYCWSLLDNYEWGDFAPTFGLIAVDRETFERTAKPSLGWLGQIAQRCRE